MAEKGRPTKYKSDYARQALAHCKLGATDKHLAELFDVSVDTITEWKNVHAEFSASIKKAKAEFDDDMVEKSLARRAMGFMRVKEVFNPEGVKELIQEEVPPDTTACIFWLKNRKSKQWRDKQEHELSGELKLTPALEIIDPTKK